VAASLVEKTWGSIQGRLQEALKDNFPIEGRKNTLVLHNVRIDDRSADIHDLKSQEEAKIHGKTWGAPVYAEIGLVDNATGKELDRQKVKLMTLPKPTTRYSFIVDGNEWQVDNLWRLRSGVYAHKKQNEEFQAEFNLASPFARSPRLYIPFNPEKKSFKLKFESTHLPLYSILKVLGVSDDEMKKTWPDAVYKANVVSEKKYQQNIEDFYDKLSKRGVKAEADTAEAKAAAIWKTFDNAKLLPETTKATLGKPFHNVNGEALLVASKRILDVARGDIPQDDRDSLIFKKLHSVEDFLHEKLTKPQTKFTIKQKISHNIDRQEKVRDIISGEFFSRPVHDFFVKSTLSRNPEQVNPLEMMSNHRATTIIAPDEGGIKNEQSVTKAMKLINPSHFGFLDPLHTPESEKTGITLHLPLGVIKDGQEAKTRVYDLKSHKIVSVGPAELHIENVILPDQVTWKKQRPEPIAKTVKMKDPTTHEILEKPFTDGRYLILSAHQLFDESTNLIPFLQNDQGNRTMVAAKQLSQAVSLYKREAPLVQVKSGTSKSWERIIGTPWAHESPTDGQIVDIKKNQDNGYAESIVIKGTDGKKHEVQIYNHFPLNDAKSFLHSTQLVKVGDKVKKEQVISDTNYTRDGYLSLGTNLRVSYLPYKGYNFEDGIVISNSAAQKLTSEHVHRHSIEIDTDKDFVDKKKFIAYASTTAKKLTKEQMAKVGDDGIIHVGQKVMPGDVLIAAIGKRELGGEAARAIGRLDKRMFAFEDKSISWESQHPGEVVKVIRNPNGKGATVFVKTLEPAEIGDKMVGRHGNKGIITRILPDTEMPRIGSSEGKHVEVLMNPSGVPTRINLGQMLETAAAKIAEKTGKPYFVQNFAGANLDYTQKVKDDLKNNNLSDTESLYDPTTGRKLGDVLSGHQYIMKLKHQVEKKLSVRAAGPSYTIDMAPKGTGAENPGQAIGQLEFYALLAHGARANLREMATYKAGKQSDHPKDETTHIDFWHRVQIGQPLPAPKSPFAYKKFEALLTGLGVNIKKEGHNLVLQPLTDKGVLALSNGEIIDPGRVLRGKDAKELEKGLFDPKITGGLPNDVGKGTKWAHISLPEPVPNPIFVGTQQHPGPAVVLSGLKFDDFEEVARGHKNIGSKTGGEALKSILKGIEVKSEMTKLRESLPKLRGSDLDKANRKMKFLMALDKLGMKPHEAYLMNYIPVLPPIFRPIVPLQDGSLRFDDINHHYKSLGELIKQYREAPKELGEEGVKDLRDSIYDVTRSLAGLPGGHPVYDSNRKMKGILDTISGASPKEGFFQKRLMKRRQELSMRSTIIPEPAMHLDHVGLPREAAMELYKPFVVREMQLLGYSPIQALKEVKQSSDLAWKSLQNAMDKRPVLLKRDPALHKFSIMAFKPKIVGGKAIQIHPLVTAGYNADFDGDQTLGTVFFACSPSVRQQIIDGDLSLGTEVRVARSADWWDKRRMEDSMAARFREQVGFFFEGDIYICNLEDFPHGEEHVTKGHIDFHPVPPGIQVISYNEQTGRFCLAPVFGWSKHRDRQVELINLASGRQLVADDDPRAVYGLDESLRLVRKRPREALGMFVPVAHTLNLPDSLARSIPLPQGDPRLRPEAPLTAQLGRLLGTLAGDGWVVTFGGQLKGQVALAAAEPSVASGFAADLTSVFLMTPTITPTSRVGGDFGDEVASHKFVVSSMGFSKFVEPLIGKKAENKHLPPFYLTAPRDFRIGLLAGLMDTDGSISTSKGKTKPQWMINFSSRSIRLVQETLYLAKSLGIRAAITPSKTPKGNAFWVVGFSAVDFHKLRELPVSHDNKQKLFQEFFFGASPEEKNSYSQIDIIPTPKWLARTLRDTVKTSLGNSIYVLLTHAFERGYISRYSAREILAKRPDLAVQQEFAFWSWMVANEAIWWDKVVSYTETGIPETGYDLTVPGFETFLSVDGITLSNTMSAFVPLTDDAIREAHKMFPSNNLFSSTHGGIMYAPDQESLLGLHLLSKWGKDSGKSFSSLQEAKKSKDQGNLHVNDVITLNGKKTTLGRLLISEHLPESIKDTEFGNMLRDPHFELVKHTKSEKRIGVHDMLERIAKQDPKNFSDTVDNLKNLGNRYSYELGFSFGLKDLHVNKELRAQILSKYDSEAHKVREDSKLTPAQKHDQVVSIYDKATDELVKANEPIFAENNNNIYKMVSSGARGKMSQFRQMTIAPMLMKDGSGNTISTPVKRSYSEGLDVGDYWTSLHGARMGTLQRVEGTSEPGRLTKEIVNVVIPNMIVSKDCKTQNGIHLDINDSDIEDRFLAAPVKLPGGQTIPSGKIIDGHVLALLKKNKVDRVVVRSPLKCAHGNGICATCYGLNESGRVHELGANIGVISGHAMGEPATQLAMDSFHTGGVAASRGGGAVDKFTRLNQLLESPKVLPNAAVLSRISGKVRRVDKDPATNGWNVFVGDEKHFIPAQRIPTHQGQPLVAGIEVKKGEPISDGHINPRELLKHTDIHAVQNYLTDQLYNSIYKDEGVKRRNLETVVRSLTNLTQIKDPGDSDHVHGDIASRTLIEEHNRNLSAGKKPIIHEPMIRGARQMALDQHEDWMARLNFQELRNTLLEGTAKGWKTNLHGTNPIPAYAYAAEFGKGTPKAPHHY
jgi:DNA-directed RNA polymerase beta subunit/DNA-directed RNA polymerase beta' subunit